MYVDKKIVHLGAISIYYLETYSGNWHVLLHSIYICMKTDFHSYRA